jgi:hypothetical protein
MGPRLNRENIMTTTDNHSTHTRDGVPYTAGLVVYHATPGRLLSPRPVFAQGRMEYDAAWGWVCRVGAVGNVSNHNLYADVRAARAVYEPARASYERVKASRQERAAATLRDEPRRLRVLADSLADGRDPAFNDDCGWDRIHELRDQAAEIEQAQINEALNGRR